ncbi:MAG: hypothetical protein QGF53_14140, partial [Alphaproteobacteria bacterium]|nr:hypothetical protein [Alphaproteobacteria bacterium]
MWPAVYPLGFMAGLAACLRGEAGRWKEGSIVALSCLALFAVIAIVWLDSGDGEGAALRLCYFHGALAVLVLAAPRFPQHHSDGAFWAYARALLLCLAFGFLCALTFCGGATLLLAGMSVLFGLEISGGTRADAWLIGIVLVWPWCALTA